ncbi:MAG: SAM-dependent methyltransferase [Flexibacter sp. CG_4_10_14_3_um_filter_32_15]|nr:MAG: SAM-dependent methyltransferase [Flexibacter sp. CG_4_10_14_3_um_filter_32_15]
MEYQLIDDIKCYAPEFAHENEGFSADSFEKLYKVEEDNFWFKSRNKVIQGLFKKYLGENKAAEVLEIGCGTGYVLNGLKNRFPSYLLMGSEIHLKGIEFAKKRLPEVDFIQLDATRIPFEGKFDAVGAFDVLEHIEEDVEVMKNVHKSLKKDGLFFISVPQYMFMWSSADDIAFHKRRYTRSEMKQKLESVGFEVEYLSSFVFALFPLMYTSRKLKGKGEANQDEENMEEFNIPPIVNKTFSAFMKIDEFLIRNAVKLPFGGSVIAVARKK